MKKLFSIFFHFLIIFLFPLKIPRPVLHPKMQSQVRIFSICMCSLCYCASNLNAGFLRHQSRNRVGLLLFQTHQTFSARAGNRGVVIGGEFFKSMYTRTTQYLVLLYCFSFSLSSVTCDSNPFFSPVSLVH